MLNRGIDQGGYLSDRLTAERRDQPEAETLLILRGELDVETAPVLNRALRDAEEDRPRRLVLELSALSFVDSTGLGLLVLAANRAADAQRQLVLRNLSDQVERLLTITGLTSEFTVE